MALILQLHPNKVNWCKLSFNINAISMLEKNQDKISWHNLSYNFNAISLIEKNLDKINWGILSMNRNAIHLLQKHQDKIDWLRFSRNENIFAFDYDYYKKRMDIHKEELIKTVFHPKRLAYYLELGYDLFEWL